MEDREHGSILGDPITQENVEVVTATDPNIAQECVETTESEMEPLLQTSTSNEPYDKVGPYLMSNRR